MFEILALDEKIFNIKEKQRAREEEAAAEKAAEEEAAAEERRRKKKEDDEAARRLKEQLKNAGSLEEQIGVLAKELDGYSK